MSIFFFIVTFFVNYYSETYALSFITSSKDYKSTLNVLEFNIHAVGDDFYCRYEELSKFIVSTKSDIVLLIEFSTQYDDYDLKLDSLLAKHYPYSSMGFSSLDDMVLYSKYPLIGYNTITIGNKNSFPMIDVEVDSKRISLLGCHFASNNYVDSSRRMEIDSVKSKMDLFTYLKAINKGYKQRRIQVTNLCAILNDNYQSSIDRMVVLGDYNDVGGSYTVNKLEKLGLKDAWWKGGFGLGGTRDTGIFSFRLDHILYGSDMDLQSIRIVETNGLSDHKALFASFNLK